MTSNWAVSVSARLPLHDLQMVEIALQPHVVPPNLVDDSASL